MKYMNTKKKYQPLDLQLFAEEEGNGGSDGDDSGEGDDQDDNDSDEDGEEEKKFSQKDVDEAVKKRLAREKRKWQREQQKNRDLGKKVGAGDEEETDDKAIADRASEAEKRANRLEVKVACFEADVAKDAVEDVAALAHAYMEADDTLDLEDAIEKVVKKYPHFKKGGADPYENEPDKGKAWGERQRGAGKKQSGVEAAFLKKNPGLKIN